MLSVRPHKSIRVNLRCQLTPPADSLKVLINPTILVHRFIFIVNIIFLKNNFVNTFSTCFLNFSDKREFSGEAAAGKSSGKIGLFE